MLRLRPRGAIDTLLSLSRKQAYVPSDSVSPGVLYVERGGLGKKPLVRRW